MTLPDHVASEAEARLLLIVREHLVPGLEAQYAENEAKIATICATLNCPHPYLALMPIAGLAEVWWINIFASDDEKTDVESAYARNQALLEALGPLGKRKEAFRRALSTTLTRYRADVSGGAQLRIAGARFLVVDCGSRERDAIPTFESEAGQRFAIAAAPRCDDAGRLAARLGADSIVLEIQPQWTYPDTAWMAADPEASSRKNDWKNS